MSWLILLFACWGDSAYIVEGTVVKVSADDEVILDHKAIEGLGMGPMTMPFQVRDPDLLEGLEPGHKVLARFEVEPDGGFLTKVRITGKGTPPKVVEETGVAPLRPGQLLSSHVVVLEDGSKALLGKGQDKPTALTFIYTRCPMPEFCPATVARYQALQAAAGDDVRLLAVTLDPAFDTPEVLSEFAKASSADPAIWRFGQAATLKDLALASGLTMTKTEGSIDIAHSIRMVVLSKSGKMIERYDDHAWSVDRVLSQLRTGSPAAHE